MCSSFTFCHNEIILKLFDKKESDKESMYTAYKRFIQGNFDVTLNENQRSD